MCISKLTSAPLPRFIVHEQSRGRWPGKPQWMNSIIVLDHFLLKKIFGDLASSVNTFPNLLACALVAVNRICIANYLERGGFVNVEDQRSVKPDYLHKVSSSDTFIDRVDPVRS